MREAMRATVLLEAVRASVQHAGRHNPGDVVPPVAVLWTDVDGQWGPLVEQLRPLMPELLTLGDYDSDTRTGPTIWLRCVIEPAVRAEAFPELTWPAEAVPVIYMPGISRQTLRAVEECPEELKPLVELQYRGVVWTQKNGKDWTVEAFLISEDGGLGLNVARDNQTRRAMLGALSQLAVTPISRLRGKRLEAEDFDRLMIGDTPRDLLLWLSDPSGVRAEWDEAKWSAFCNRCKDEYGFDPESDGEIVGGEKLGLRQDAWLAVWQRFAESPALYPGIPDLLRRAKPSGQVALFGRDAWPDEAEGREVALRDSLLEMGDMTPAEARIRVRDLESEHGARRQWVWAKLGMCPLAHAVENLAVLAEKTALTLGGESAQMMADLYTKGAYLADDAALRALACVKSAADTAAVEAAARCLYLPWLDDTAQHFQDCLIGHSVPGAREQQCVTAEPGECILFADGLRFDVGQRLVAMAEERQLEVGTAWRWAGLPTVTATTKPAVTPVAGDLSGHRAEPDFAPETDEGGQPATTQRLRQLLEAHGYQVLGPSEMGHPDRGDARGWTEYGEFDRYGHDLQSKLAARIDDQLDLLVERIQTLIEAGWRRVRVVTDHGWLLMPGGLPAVSLPKYLTESRWSRCASIKDTSHVEVPVAGWHWNRHELFAFGPGVKCFINGREYAHGGVSLQECVVPVLTFVSTASGALPTVAVKEVQWLGLRCRISAEPAVEGLKADLRTKPNDPGSSVVEVKDLDSAGKASLLVRDDSLEGTAVSLVLIDASGSVICKEPTTIGGDE